MSTSDPLYHHQQEAINAVEAAIARGVRRFIVELPTGTGKSRTFVVWSNALLAQGRRVLVIAHTDEIIRNIVEEYTGVYPDLADKIGVVKADRNEHDRPLVLASVQTISMPHRLEQVTKDFAAIVVDEAHHAAAESYLRTLAYFDAPVVAGFTATAFRADESLLVGPQGVFAEIVYTRPIAPMIKDNLLCDVRVKRMQLAYDLDQVKKTAGDYQAGDLVDVMMAHNALPHIVAGYKQELSGKRAIAYVPTVQMAYDLAHALREAGVVADTIEGGTPIEVRRAILARFKGGDVQVVVNPNVLSEGFNEPRVEGILLCRPTTSPVLFRQTIGRGLRTWPGKDVCTILDFAGATKRHDLMTVQRALGVGMKDGETAREAMIREEIEKAAAQLDAATRARMIATAVDLFRAQDVSSHWTVDPSGQVFTIWLGDAGTLDIDAVEPDATPDASVWRVVKVPDYWSGNKRETTLVRGVTLAEAQAFVQAYATRKGATKLIHRRVNTSPATEKQSRMYYAVFRKKMPAGLTVDQVGRVVNLHNAKMRHTSRRAA